MTLGQIRQSYREGLAALYPQEEIDAFFFIITEKELGYAKSKALVSLEDSIKDPTPFNQYLNQLAKGKPIQYVLGETTFFGLPFKVSSETLIPRPETEELVDWIINDNKNTQKPLSIMDIGTGTGCIAIALAKHLPNATINAIDYSRDVLEIASTNSRLNHVNINFTEQDILAMKQLPQYYDVIVSNPPYVRDKDKIEMHLNVLGYEPASALFVEDDDPFVFCKKIAGLALHSLSKNGALYFEINAYLGDELMLLLQQIGFSRVILKKDLFGRDRMIKCTVE